MQKTKLSRLLAILAVLALTAASCGSGEDETSNDTSAPEGTEAGTDSTEAEEEEEEETNNNNTLDTSLTQYREISLDAEGGEAAPTCSGESNDELEFGGLLPETGNLAFLGPPEFAGVELAVQEINEAGGVLGNDVKWSPGDSGDNGTVANQTVDRHLEDGVDVVVGAASSGVSFTVLEKISDACKVMFSPANTSPDFTTKDPGEMYFRTAPSDVGQGQVLADLIIEDGASTAAIMALQDPYGEGLLKFTKEPLEAAGVTVVTDFTYDPKAASFDSEVEKVTGDDPDAIVVIGFDESAEILSGLFEKGIGTDQIYLVDGNVGNALGEKFEPGQLTGIRGTFPTAEITEDFESDMLGIDSELIDFTYGPESYDAVIISALAAIAADSDSPSEIAKNINGITRDGTECTSFADCKKILEDGGEVAYTGPSGPSEFSQPGERTKGSMAIVEYG